MAEQNKNPLLGKLLELSKVDVALARIVAEKKKLETDLLAAHASLKKEELAKIHKQKISDEKNASYTKEEKRLRDEWDKLSARRKALSSLNNYKLQESGEKEIEHASRQIKSQEESLLKILEDIEVLSTQIAQHTQSHSAQKTVYNEKIKEAKIILANLEERTATHNKTRQELAVSIDPKNLIIYERVKERFIMDPLVPIVNNLCSGCNMQIGPQVIVLIGKDQSLVRCPGCARILYLNAANEGEQKSEAV